MNSTGRRRRSRSFLIILSVVVIVAVVAILLTIRERPMDQERITIGAILPLSGNLGFMGKMEGDGMKLAVEDINAEGGVNGVPLELRFDDSQGKPDLGVTAAQRMLTVDRINILIASFSGVALGIKPVVEREGGILIGACMHPDFFKGTPNVFRFYIGVEDESKGFVDYLTSLKGTIPDPRVGLLYVEAPNVVEQIEKYVEPGLAEVGMSFAVKESYRLSDKEFRDKILKIRSADVSHLLIIGYGFLYPNIFQELKDQKILDKVQIVGGWGFLYPNVSSTELEGVVVVGPKYVFEGSETVQSFDKRFEIEFGYKANFDAAMTYAAVELVATGLAASSDQTSSSLSRALKDLPQTRTLIGDVRIRDDGSISFPIAIGIYKHGVLVSLSSY